jgi:hypothetical protein
MTTITILPLIASFALGGGPAAMAHPSTVRIMRGASGSKPEAVWTPAAFISEAKASHAGSVILEPPFPAKSNVKTTNKPEAVAQFLQTALSPRNSKETFLPRVSNEDSREALGKLENRLAGMFDGRVGSHDLMLEGHELHWGRFGDGPSAQLLITEPARRLEFKIEAPNGKDPRITEFSISRGDQESHFALTSSLRLTQDIEGRNPIRFESYLAERAGGYRAQLQVKLKKGTRLMRGQAERAATLALHLFQKGQPAK